MILVRKRRACILWDRLMIVERHACLMSKTELSSRRGMTSGGTVSSVLKQVEHCLGCQID